jgi:hypothetical protein
LRTAFVSLHWERGRSSASLAKSPNKSFCFIAYHVYSSLSRGTGAACTGRLHQDIFIFGAFSGSNKHEDVDPKTLIPFSLLHRRMQELSEEVAEAPTTRGPPQPDPPTPDDTAPDKHNYTMAILEGVIGGVVLLAVLIGFAVFRRCRQRSAGAQVHVAVRINFDASVTTVSTDFFFLICA